MTDRIAMKCSPDDSERLPWTITANDTPTVRVADSDHSADAPVTAQGPIADG